MSNAKMDDQEESYRMEDDETFDKQDEDDSDDNSKNPHNQKLKSAEWDNFEAKQTKETDGNQAENEAKVEKQRTLNRMAARRKRARQKQKINAFMEERDRLTTENDTLSQENHQIRQMLQVAKNVQQRSGQNEGFNGSILGPQNLSNEQITAQLLKERLAQSSSLSLAATRADSNLQNLASHYLLQQQSRPSVNLFGASPQGFNTSISSDNNLSTLLNLRSVGSTAANSQLSSLDSNFASNLDIELLRHVISGIGIPAANTTRSVDLETLGRPSLMGLNSVRNTNEARPLSDGGLSTVIPSSSGLVSSIPHMDRMRRQNLGAQSMIDPFRIQASHPLLSHLTANMQNANSSPIRLIDPLTLSCLQSSLQAEGQNEPSIQLSNPNFSVFSNASAGFVDSLGSVGHGIPFSAGLGLRRDQKNSRKQYSIETQTMNLDTSELAETASPVSANRSNTTDTIQSPQPPSFLLTGNNTDPEASSLLQTKPAARTQEQDKSTSSPHTKF